MLNEEKGTMRNEQAAITRKKLIDAAQTLFAQKGYAATAVREINRSINMADGLLYHYFPGGKKEILRTIVDENVKEITGAMSQISDDLKDLSLEDYLETFYIRANEIFTMHDDAIRIIFRDFSTLDLPEKQALLQHLDCEKNKFLPDELRRRASIGEIKEIDFDCAAHSLVSMLINQFLLNIIGIPSDISYNKDCIIQMIKFNVDLWKN